MVDSDSDVVSDTSSDDSDVFGDTGDSSTVDDTFSALDCSIDLIVNAGNWGSEMSFDIVDANGVVVFTLPAGSFNNTFDDFQDFAFNFTGPLGTYTVQAQDTYGDGWNGGYLTVSSSGVALDQWTFTSGSSATTTFDITDCTEDTSVVDSDLGDTSVFADTADLDCDVELSLFTGIYAAEIGFDIVDAATGSVAFSFATNTYSNTFDNQTVSFSFGADAGTYVVNAVDTYGDGWNNGSITVTTTSGIQLDAWTLAKGSAGSTLLTIECGSDSGFVGDTDTASVDSDTDVFGDTDTASVDSDTDVFGDTDTASVDTDTDVFGDSDTAVTDSAVVDSALTGDTSNLSCATGQIADCNGVCWPSVWVGDGFCDDGALYSWGDPDFFNCGLFPGETPDCVGDTDTAVTDTATVDTGSPVVDTGSPVVDTAGLDTAFEESGLRPVDTSPLDSGLFADTALSFDSAGVDYSCDIDIDFFTGFWAGEISFELVANATGATVFSLPANSYSNDFDAQTETFSFVGEPGIYTLVAGDSYGDGWNLGAVTVSTSGGIQLNNWTLRTGSSGSQSFVIDCDEGETGLLVDTFETDIVIDTFVAPDTSIP